MKPELLAPAGHWSALTTAVENGADSVYFGIKGFNMRDRADNFDLLELAKIMEYLHKHGRKGYLALNTIIFDEEVSRVAKILISAKKAHVDAVILWDMAVLQLAKEAGLKIHLSTQASLANTLSVRFYASAGVERVILARECTLAGIRAISSALARVRCPCELEVFVHGAMCLSISGRCLLSLHSHGRSANRGQCDQPCRRQYYIQDQQGKADFLLEGDHLLSPRDLCTIDFLEQILESGVTAFKIEGRMRSAEYVGVVTSSYRQAIDAWQNKKLDDQLKQVLRNRLSTVYNRGFTDGFFFGPPSGDGSRGLGHSHEKIFLGDIQNYYKKIQVAEIRILNESLHKGDELLIMGKNTPAFYAFADEMEQSHQSVTTVTKGEVVALLLPVDVRPKDKVFLWRKVR